jgi:hypothetical protein
VISGDQAILLNFITFCAVLPLILALESLDLQGFHGFFQQFLFPLIHQSALHWMQMLSMAQ